MGRLANASSEVPEGEEIPAWNRLLTQSIFEGHLETVGSQPLNLALKANKIGRAIAIDATTSPVLYAHASDAVPEKQRRVILQTPLEGVATYLEDGAGRYVARPGDLTIGESSQAGSFVCEQPVRLVGLALPREAIVPRFAQDADFRRDISATFAGRLLVDLLAGIARGELGYAREATLAQAVGGLLALAFESPRSGLLGEGETSASRLAAVRDYLRAHYADCGLSPAGVANKFHISLRHLHRLMEQTGRSFGEELQAIRLEAALAALQDPAQCHRSVADIAFAAGFNDLSNFNRKFRAHYGATPSEARRR